MNIAVSQHNTQADAERFERQVLWLTGGLGVHLAVVALGWLPAATFALSIPVVFVRWLNTIHEIAHVRGPDRVRFWVQVFPLPVSPLAPGYRELRVEHLGHHAFFAAGDEADGVAEGAQAADPTDYLVRGGTLRGLLAALTAPEQLVVRHVLAHGIDRRLVVQGLTRAALFFGAWWLAGPAFVAFAAVLRLTWAASFFTFFRALHRRGPAVGLYALPFPPWAARLVKSVWGLEVHNAIAHHDRHHHTPRVAARNLHITLN